MATNKTANDIIIWLKEVIAPRVKNQMEIIPHGGTAMALRGLKGNTKDVDFNIIEREWFDEFCKILVLLGYEREIDSMPRGRDSQLVRFISGKYPVDVVDLHYPTWNNWSITDDMKRRATILEFGELMVVIPNGDTIFLFKTYPCRPTDISDLDQFLSKESIDIEYIVNLFNDQEEFLGKLENGDPVKCIVNLRTRFYLSLAILKKNRRSIKRLYDFALKKFRPLGIKMDIEELTMMIGGEELEWDKFIHKNHKKLAKALGIS